MIRHPEGFLVKQRENKRATRETQTDRGRARLENLPTRSTDGRGQTPRGRKIEPWADSPRTENRALAWGHSAEPDGLDSSRPVRRALPLPPQRERTWTPFPELDYESLVSENDATGGEQ